MFGGRCKTIPSSKRSSMHEECMEMPNGEKTMNVSGSMRVVTMFNVLCECI